MPPLLDLAVVPLLLVGVVAGLRRPVSLLLPAYAATVPFGSLLSTGLSPPYDSVSTPLGMLLIVALGSQAIFGRTARARFPPVLSIWLLFLAVTGVTAVWSVSPQLTEVAFRNLALLVVLYVLVALTPVSLPELRRVETALVAGGVLASTYGIFQFVTGTLPVDPEAGGGGRFGRDLLGANNTAAALMVPLAIAVCRSAAAPSWRTRSGHIVAVATLLFGILLTGSRGGLLSTAALLLVAIWYVERNRAFLVRTVLLIVMAAGLVLLLQPGGIAGRTDSTSSSGRSEIWKIGLHACQTFCVRGSGWGTFPRVYEMTQPEVPEARTLERGVAYEPHNIWLLIGIETGLAGFGLAVIGLLLTVRDCHRLPNYLRGPPLAGMVGTLVAAFFLSNFEYKFFWMTLTYVLMCRSVALTHRVSPSPQPRAAVPEPSPDTPMLTT